MMVDRVYIQQVVYYACSRYTHVKGPAVLEVGGGLGEKGCSRFIPLPA